MKNYLLLTTAIATAATFGAISMDNANAKTVSKTTEYEVITTSETDPVNFTKFDLDNDGIYTMEEVGEELFYAFDQDGNEVLDKGEWEDKLVLTIQPVQKTTAVRIDYDDDGELDTATYTYERFYEDTGLIRFDDNANGLSAAEFIDEPFMVMDDNDTRTIDLQEWKEAYLIDVVPHLEPERYNN